MKIYFTSLGAPNFSSYLAQLTDNPHFEYSNVVSEFGTGDNMVFVVGMYGPKNRFYERLPGQAVIMICGTDILEMLAMPKPQLDDLVRRLRDRGVVFTTDAPTTTVKMRQLIGGEITTVNLPSKFEKELFTDIDYLPDAFNIGCYQPPHRAGHYRMDLVIEAARRLPDCWFHVYFFKGHNKSYNLPNIVPYPDNVTNMREFISCMACGLRITTNDTFSMSAIEFMMCGRWFVNNHEMPFSDKLSHTPSVDEVVGVLKRVRERKTANLEGCKFYRENYTLEGFKSTLAKLFQQVKK